MYKTIANLRIRKEHTNLSYHLGNGRLGQVSSVRQKGISW
jgi:hypothetical protein